MTASNESELWYYTKEEKDRATKGKFVTSDGRTIELPEGVHKDKIGWILRCACTDINYRSTIPQLSAEELKFCLKHERRITGKRQLLSELRKRGETL